MYGTVARMRLKPGMEGKLAEQLKQFDDLKIPGIVGEYVYRMDTDSNEFWMAVAFESKEAYRANAESPEQDARYRDLRALMESDPEWHDGEIVYSPR